jgi:hypothetical protein
MTPAVIVAHAASLNWTEFLGINGNSTPFPRLARRSPIGSQLNAEGDDERDAADYGHAIPSPRAIAGINV